MKDEYIFGDSHDTVYAYKYPWIATGFRIVFTDDGENFRLEPYEEKIYADHSEEMPERSRN